MRTRHDSETRAGAGPSLATGGLAALLASSCCLGPLVLLAVGISGPWLVHLTSLERYQPVFVAIAIAALAVAWRPIWRPVSACDTGKVCAAPPARRAYKALFVSVAALLLVSIASPLVAPWFY
ncbi:MAG: mercuric transport protein [Burkholderiales bacterium]|nr:MAG: mercuric transport protein [Burkholderiales bacterium]